MASLAARLGLRRAVGFVQPRVQTRVQHYKSAATMAATGAESKYLVLQYKYVPDIAEKRTPYREQHIGAAKQMGAEGKLVMAGALQDPLDGGLFIFKDTTKQEVEAFVKGDAYVNANLVTEWSIRPWAVVVQESDFMPPKSDATTLHTI